jgi:DNA-binding transcriptional MerR regulator
MNSMTAAERVGITYRQLDYWIRQGFIKGALPGTGHPRSITGAEFRVLERMATLVKAGVEPQAAGKMARRLARGRSVFFADWLLEP